MERERRSLSPQLEKAALKVDTLSQPGVGNGENPFLCRRNGGLLPWTLRQARGRYVHLEHLPALHGDAGPGGQVDGRSGSLIRMVGNRRYPPPHLLKTDLGCQLLQLGKGSRWDTGWDAGWDLQISQRLCQGLCTEPPGRERARVRAQPRMFTKTPLT